jgi:aryl-alcohol dehydrogenase-like predicted oxidoreductase
LPGQIVYRYGLETITARRKAALTMSDRLALGTVQFGMEYGVANTTGHMSAQTAKDIVDVARQTGIRTLDTAALYGTSESVLGAMGVGDLRIVSKLPGLPDTPGDVLEWVNDAVRQSLKRLDVDRLGGLLLHRPTDLTGPSGRALFDALRKLRDRGLVAKIGYSVYSPAELEQLFDDFPPDLIQAPYNVFDRRLESTGWLSKLGENGVEVHTRSAFLQGLLLMPRHAIPAKFAPWQDLLSSWHDWCDEAGKQPMQAALSHALAQPGIACVVVGVDSPSQLRQIADAASGTGESAPPQLLSNDETLINPARWGAL